MLVTNISKVLNDLIRLLVTILPDRQDKDSGIKSSAGTRQKHIKHKEGF